MLAKSLRHLFLLTLMTCAIAPAQEYPNKAVVVVVPFAAGGPTDTLARQLAFLLSAELKQQIVIDNTLGAGGTVGINKVAKARNDGYTLLLMHIGMSTSPSLYKELPYNTLNDFEYIGQIADVPMTLIGKAGLPPDNLKDLITYIKANKDKLNMGNAGVGAASHLCGLLFLSAIQTQVTTVPYNGTGPAMNALAGNQIDLMCDQTTNTTQQILAGKVKVYGVTSKIRVPALRYVPTLNEAGLKNFEVVVWHGLYAPKGTPKPILDRLHAALWNAVKDPSFRTQLEMIGAEPVSLSKVNAESLRTHLTAEIDKWAKIFKAAGVPAN